MIQHTATLTINMNTQRIFPKWRNNQNSKCLGGRLNCRISSGGWGVYYIQRTNGVGGNVRWHTFAHRSHRQPQQRGRRDGSENNGKKKRRQTIGTRGHGKVRHHSSNKLLLTSVELKYLYTLSPPEVFLPNSTLSYPPFYPTVQHCADFDTQYQTEKCLFKQNSAVKH